MEDQLNPNIGVLCNGVFGIESGFESPENVHGIVGMLLYGYGYSTGIQIYVCIPITQEHKKREGDIMPPLP
ncbi:MAG: hypothetical protein ACXW02_07355 [Halobacteriota archaeon]